MRLSILLLIFLLHGCCAFTSKDCGCKPPDPDLNSEALKWIEPYNALEEFIFQDSSGLVDTFEVFRTSDTEYCGGDECGNQCQLETATLISKQDSGLKFSFTATMQWFLRINTIDESSELLFDEIALPFANGPSINNNIISEITNEYEWNNDRIQVWILKCLDDITCGDFAMKEIVVSRDFGLIEYVTRDGVRWKSKN